MVKLSHNPLVSIIIPCYNHSQFVQETVQSVIDQSYQNIELIIIDDGSKDNSVKKIQEMIPTCEARFKRFEFRHRGNAGLNATLNEALTWCEGEYFSVIASDDILLTHKTAVQVKYLNENKDCVGVFGGIDVIDEKGEVIRSKVFRSAKYNFNDIFLYKHALPTPTQLLRRDSVLKAGSYNPDFMIEDLYMWLKITEDGANLGYINDVFARYRRHPGNLSGKLEAMHEGRLEIISQYESHRLYSRALSAIYLVYAHDLQPYGKLLAAYWAAKSVRTNSKIIFNKSPWKFFVKMFL